MGFKSGYVTILGRPNVGKSTLLNYLVGEKISIVTYKPQTTRRKILGIANFPQGQIIIIDTPGLHKHEKELNKAMMREALSSLEEGDLIIYITDVDERNFEKDYEYIKMLEGKKAILFINKIDLIKKSLLLPMIEKYHNTGFFLEIVPISLIKGDNLDRIVDVIFKYLPEGPQYYPEDMKTPQTLRFLVSEIIREKIFLKTREEIPYSTSVLIDYFEEEDNLVRIGATIIVEKDSQKKIVIGAKGSMIKEIGKSAREEIELLLGKKVYLELYVKVVKNWTKDAKKVQQFF